MHPPELTAPGPEFPLSDLAVVTPLWTAAELRQLDDAIDYAARVTQGTVSEFLAAPSAPTFDGSRCIEIAVEFFVPPCSLVRFAEELDRALTRRSPSYSTARRAGGAGAARVTALSPSMFHQWRMAWKIDSAAQHDRRWSPDRRMLDELLRYANSGWRELFAVE